FLAFEVREGLSSSEPPSASLCKNFPLHRMLYLDGFLLSVCTTTGGYSMVPAAASVSSNKPLVLVESSKCSRGVGSQRTNAQQSRSRASTSFRALPSSASNQDKSARKHIVQRRLTSDGNLRKCVSVAFST